MSYALAIIYTKDIKNNQSHLTSTYPDVVDLISYYMQLNQ